MTPVRSSVALAFVLPLAATSAAADESKATEVGEQDALSGDSKQMGLHTPRGRAIYHADETFGAALDTRRRSFVLEAAVGWGPEGNLGIVFGFLPKALHGVEFYGGFGIEANPAYQISGAVRFLFNIYGFRPYVGVGYFYKNAFVVDTFAHNVFAEVGYSFKLGPTRHLTVGGGVARVLYVGARNTSILRSPEIDESKLQAQLDEAVGFRPVFALRFSHAF